MARDQRAAELLLRIRSDRRALTQAIADLDLTRKGIREVANQAKYADVSLSRSGSGALTLGQRLRGTTVPAIEQTSREFAELRTQALAATVAMEQAGAASSGSGAGGAGRGSMLSRLRGLRVETLGREIVGLPSVQLGPISSNDLGQGLRLAGQQGATFAGIAAAMAPVVAIAAPLAAAFFALEASLQGAKSQLDGAVIAVRRFFDMIAEGATTAEAQARKAEIERLLPVARNELNTLRGGPDAAFADLAASGGGGIIGDIGARFVTAGQTLSSADDALSSSIDEVTAEVTALEQELASLDREIANGGFVANDATAKEEALTAARQDGAIAATEAAFAIKAAADALQVLKDTTGKTETVNALAAAEANLNAKRELGVAITKQLADAQAEADQQLAALEKTKVARGIEAERKLLEGMIAIDAELARAQGDALADLRKGLADAQAEANDGLAEAERDAGLERIKAKREHEQTLAKIERDAQRGREVAIQDRNAVALDNVEANRQQATDDENESYLERRIEINNRLSETQRDIARQLAKQQKTVRDSYQQQLNTAAEAARRARDIEVAKQNALLGVQQIGQANAIGAAKAFAAQFPLEIAKGLNNALAVTGSLGKGIDIAKVIPKAHTGADIVRSGLLNVRAGERVYTERQQSAGFTFAPVINGMTWPEVQGGMTREMRKFVKMWRDA